MWQSKTTQRAHRTAFAALILGACQLLPAQSSTPSSANQPIYRARTQEVIVDVVVSPDEKKPSPKLNAKDFSISEDGKPQKISFFEEHTAKTLLPGAVQPLPAMPPNVYTNVPPAPESDAVNILLLDSLNTGIQDQSYVRNEAIAYLKAMAPGTEIAIFSLGTKLDLLERFTTDRASLLSTLGEPAEPEGTAAPPQPADSPSGDPRKGSAGTKSKASPPRTAAWRYPGDAYVIFKHHPDIRERMTLEALDYLGRYLAAIPGRKNLIWISDEFLVTIFPSLSQRQDMENTPEIANHAKRTADMLTRARVAIYPIQAEGMMNDKLAEAGNPLPGMARRPSPASGGGGESRIPMGNEVMSTFNAEAAQRADTIYSMEQLASDTGGKAFYNTNDLNSALARAVRDGSHYYTLMYTPTNSKLDGSYRRIKVKLANGNYKLSYRQGYNADSLSAPSSSPESDSDPLHPLMRLGMPDSTEILYALRVVPAADQPAASAPRAGKNDKLTGPVTRLSVDFMIRWSDVRFTPVEDGKQKGKQSGRIQVELVACDPDGNAVNWIGGTEEMFLDPTAYASIQKSGIPAHLEVDVPKGKNLLLSTGVYDWQTGKIGTLQVPIPASARTAVAQSAAAVR